MLGPAFACASNPNPEIGWLAPVAMAFSERALQEPSDVVASDAPAVDPSDGVPLDDAIAAQSVLCKTLSTLGTTHAPDGGYLHAVLALDRQAKSVEKALLAAYVDGNAPSRPLDSRYLISARLLSRSFVHAYERVLDGLKECAGDTPRKVAAAVLVQLFRHRRVEFLLRSLRYKKRNSEQWRQLHKVYRFAQRGNVIRCISTALADTLCSCRIEAAALVIVGQIGLRELCYGPLHRLSLLTIECHIRFEILFPCIERTGRAVIRQSNDG